VALLWRIGGFQLVAGEGSEFPGFGVDDLDEFVELIVALCLFL
jgi:hypothetical protein